MQRRSLKWRVTYRIDVHTIPDSFSSRRRHEKLSSAFVPESVVSARKKFGTLKTDLI